LDVAGFELDRKKRVFSAGCVVVVDLVDVVEPLLDRGEVLVVLVELPVQLIVSLQFFWV
jgi:hypothetical protein